MHARAQATAKILVVGILLAVQASAQRDPWLWPFAVKSIWNLPIHKDAHYVAANLPPHGRYGVDVNYLLKEEASDPEVSVYKNTTWGPGRCTNEGFLFKMHFPHDLVVRDASSNNTPNNNLAFMMVSGKVRQDNVLARCVAGGPVYMRSWYKDIDPRGDGVTNSGGQGASRMTSFGGTLRRGELTGDEPIRHALKFTIWADEYFYYGSSGSSCYRWPASACDGYADESGRYRGDHPKLVMGILLAIKPGVSLASLDLETEPGRKLFAAMQTYGGYVVEDAAWDKWYLIAEQGVKEEVKNTYGLDLETGTSDGPFKRDMDKLVPLLHVVDNNGPGTIGGGDTDDLENRLAAAAPAFDGTAVRATAPRVLGAKAKNRARSAEWTLTGRRLEGVRGLRYKGVRVSMSPSRLSVTY